MKKFLLLLALLPLLWSSCNSDDNDPKSEICDFLVRVDAQKFANTPTSGYSIISAGIEDDCLSIQIESGGCDGNSWVPELIDSGSIAESSPEQRSITLGLTNTEPCDAIVLRTYTFELTPLRISGSNAIILRLTDWEGELLYAH